MRRRTLPVAWYGGKDQHKGWLLPIIDGTPHVCYNETHGGSGALLLQKEPSPVEVYNDIHGEVVNFFRVLRDDPEGLVRLLELTPYSREEFALACGGPDGSAGPLERARRFFVVARQVTLGLATTATPGRWCSLSRQSRRGMSLVVSRYLSAIEGLPEFAGRLREVQIENLDALRVIDKYDGPGTLHYVDPPFWIGARPGGRAYRHEYAEKDHLDLLSLLKGVRGKVILSGYSNEAYERELAGWNSEERKLSSVPSTRRKSQRGAVEKIWKNF